MERFKVLEKETKTKAYSKEGLSQSAKRSANENREEPNSEIIEWIDDVIQRIKDQQAEIEGLLDYSWLRTNLIIVWSRTKPSSHWQQTKD